MSETQTSDSGSGDDDRNLPARDHDGYHSRTHFFGDACPGGHLNLTEAELDELEREPIDDGRYDKEVDPQFVELYRRAETYYSNDGTQLPLYLIRRLRREAELEASRQEELWEDDNPEAHL